MSFIKNKRKSLKIISVLSALLLGAVVMCGVYLNDFYHADTAAIETFCAASVTEAKQDDDGYLVFEPENAQAGFIFYPGGKVEYTAYIPLMQALSDEGVLCVLVKMPFNLAVLDMDAAEGVQQQYPHIKSWYIGGHSLGGAMAASYIADCQEAFDGLVLLGAYSTADLSQTDLEVLSVYGSEDMVMNREKYNDNISNLPQDFTEIIIEGGCHACFGMYGTQEGDGTPSITGEEQIILTAEEIFNMILQQ